MGWVVFIVVIGLLLYAGEEPAKGVPLILLIVAGFIAFICWGRYTDSDAYKEKKRQAKISQGKNLQNSKMNANMDSINRMAKGALFTQLKSDIWACNKAAYARAAENQCRYNHKPQANSNMLEFPSLTITNTQIRGSRTIDLHEYGFKDLTNDQIQVLGMALVKYGKFQLRETDLEKHDMDFSQLEANWDYWQPYVENYIDYVYTNKRREYEKTHKSIY